MQMEKVGLERIFSMLEFLTEEMPLFPPTILYNEGWLLRLVLDWFSTHSAPRHPLTFPKQAKWFSEALLPSAFLPRRKRDPLAESWTHADGVIGHFDIHIENKAALSLSSEAAHFKVIEAKMFSPLSPKVTNASYFDQAARNVACIAEVLRRANRFPSEMTHVGFCLIAPASQFEKKFFENLMDKDSIAQKVKRRVEEYNGEKNSWFREWFEPTLEKVEVKSVSWEETIETVKNSDKEGGNLIKNFYNHCVEFNRSEKEEKAFYSKSSHS